MKKKISTTFFYLLIISIFSISCSKLPEGLTYKSPNRDERIGVRRTTFFIEVKDERGRKIPGLLVQAKSIADGDQDISDKTGRATLTLSMRENDSLEFFFKSKRPAIEWTRVVSSIPKGQKEITYVFKASSIGKVRLIEVSY